MPSMIQVKPQNPYMDQIRQLTWIQAWCQGIRQYAVDGGSGVFIPAQAKTSQ